MLIPAIIQMNRKYKSILYKNLSIIQKYISAYYSYGILVVFGFSCTCSLDSSAVKIVLLVDLKYAGQLVGMAACIYLAPFSELPLEYFIYL
jgi:hypothetical protein